MSSRKRRAVGPALAGADLEAAVWAIAAQNPGLVALQEVGTDGVTRRYPIVRHLVEQRRTGRYGYLDDGQVLRAWSEATARVPTGASRRRFITELGVDKSTAYRWRKRYGLRFPSEKAA